MIKLGEKKGFTILPEGTAVLKITEVNYNADFGKLEVKLISKAGVGHTERYMLQDQDGEVNEKALNAFSWFARTALQSDNDEAHEIDEQELVGKYIKCKVTHVKREGKGKFEGRTFTNAQLSDYEEANGFITAKASIDF